MDNLQALNKTVSAIRGIERWGTGDMIKAAFAGFKELPQPKPSTEQTWYHLFAVHPDASRELIEDRYKQLVKVRHPDKGGTHEGWIALQKAYNEAISQFK